MLRHSHTLTTSKQCYVLCLLCCCTYLSTQPPHSSYRQGKDWLQDELVTALRGDGRKQAAQRMLRQKKDGQLVSYDSSGFESASS